MRHTYAKTRSGADDTQGKGAAPARRKPARAGSPPARQSNPKAGAGLQPGRLSADEWRLLADGMPGDGPGDD